MNDGAASRAWRSSRKASVPRYKGGIAMRDPDLFRRAQLAAAELERAWYRWRAAAGPVTDPMPTVSSYVGYSLEEPWGQPRVVLGIAAEDAEQLAGLLDRHEDTR